METAIIVKINATDYRVLTVLNHTPPNYICAAPTDAEALQALIEEQATGQQTLISAWVDSQINPEE